VRIVPLAALAVALAAISGLGRAADDAWLAPAALAAGDTVALVAPCGISPEADVRRYADSFREAGFRVRLDPALPGRRDRYLAGTDDERTEELNRALRDPEVRGVFVLRGGFGLTRILDRLDYEALRRDPKVIAGFSDVTALHLAVGRRARVVTFHAPMASSVRVVGPDPTFAERSFRDTLLLDPTAAGRKVPTPDGSPVTTVVGGRCEGRLVGGNLSLIAATLGTPYAIDARDAVLLLEDVDERAYRVDRMMSHLRLAGVLDDVAGVVLGRFTAKDAEEQSMQQEVVLEYCRALGCPVVANFPCGHVADNATLPLGARVTLDADAGTLTILEPTCGPPRR